MIKIKIGQLIRLQPNASQPDSPYFKKGAIALVAGTPQNRSGYFKALAMHRGKEEYMYLDVSDIAEVINESR